MSCEAFRRETDPSCRERCGKKAIGYVVSGPMFVCWIHARYWENHGEPVVITA